MSFLKRVARTLIGLFVSDGFLFCGILGVIAATAALIRVGIPNAIAELLLAGGIALCVAIGAWRATK